MNKEGQDNSESDFKKKQTGQVADRIANQDYYINQNGLFVFTSEYHKKRGFCCKNNCLNCPYRESKTK